jgi:hypothetical protein
MKTLIQDQSGTIRSLPKTTQSASTVPIMKRGLTPGTAARLENHVETGLTQILNMRVGCWRPPMYVTVTR